MIKKLWYPCVVHLCRQRKRKLEREDQSKCQDTEEQGLILTPCFFQCLIFFFRFSCYILNNIRSRRRRVRSIISRQRTLHNGTETF